MYEEYIPFIQRVAAEMAPDMTQGTVVISIPLAILKRLGTDFEDLMLQRSNTFVYSLPKCDINAVNS